MPDESGLSLSDSRIHGGGNSGYQLVGLAFLWGASRIILLGYDMQMGPRGERHHHPEHPARLGGPTVLHLQEWARNFRQLGIDLRKQGIEVINASRQTAITCFERLTIHEALRRTQTVRAYAGMTACVQVRQELLPAEHAAFASGLQAIGYTLSESDTDLALVWGGSKDAPRGKRVIVAENGYLPAPDGPYVALALDGHNGAGRVPPASRERFDRMGWKLQPWRAEGGHILVCPSRGIGRQPMPKDWVEQTVAELKKHTDREIRVRPHPGNWKRLAEHPDASLYEDLRDAWACVIWASSAGLRALLAGVPVISTAPHWIAADAAGHDLEQIESPPMPDRQPVFERIAAAQWTLEEIASGEAIRRVTELDQLTVLCVLKTGGDYDAEYVRKLRDGCAKHLTIPHRFVCLSDVDVPCERIRLRHGWPGWWSKIEVFRPDVITGPTLYLDLDTVIVDNLDPVASIKFDFAMLNVREKDTMVGNSGAMWISKPFPNVYHRFAAKPEYWIDFHIKNAHDRYMGDQAFISDCFHDIPKLHHALPGFFKSYKYDRCQDGAPKGCSVVCFGGHPRPHEAPGWVRRAWV